MQKGHIDMAVVHPDVTKLDQAYLREHKLAVGIIVAAFPCIGFSTAGKQLGFGNAQSNLFFEFVLFYL